MFSGIVFGKYSVQAVELEPSLVHLSIELEPCLVEGLKKGASVSVDGTCLTVVNIQEQVVSFDLIEETLRCTTLSQLKPGCPVNIERSLKFGDEIGGHLLSGHVVGTASIERIIEKNGQREVWFRCNPDWMEAILPKGFIAIDGASLTVVGVEREGCFSVHLIPETLRVTTLGQKEVGDLVNLELDSQTQTIVATVKRYLTSK
jgi:riboflavin synthase